MVITVVVVAGCGGGTGGSTAVSSPSNSSTPPATTSPVATPSSGGTADDATWLAGVVALATKMRGPTESATVTEEYLREEAKRMGNCGAELAQLGPPTDRLQSVLVLAEQACDKYEEGAECFTAAGSNIAQSGECLDAINEGSELFSTAETTAAGLMDT